MFLTDRACVRCLVYTSYEESHKRPSSFLRMGNQLGFYGVQRKAKLPGMQGLIQASWGRARKNYEIEEMY